jgi:hypothetical protein
MSRISEFAAVVEAQAQQVRQRLGEPLLRPPRFGSAQEYRAWKARRDRNGNTRSPLQWPLWVWVLIGLALLWWVVSLVV